ncbi:MAG TPA: DUF6361 family protein, partial [Chloroflexota bacterium]|nr:DUF6361 family protein [Chloroflexota bacterium]
MVGLIDQFRDKTTLDELGFGTIRDSFGDYFFPGITTIQTRARYLLFVPWIYQALEREGLAYDAVEPRARRDLARLAAALQSGGEGDAQGLIGIRAGEQLQRTPAVVYWTALQRFGLWTYAGNMAQYYEAKLRAGPSAALTGWRPGMPGPPRRWLESTSFALTAQEADYLRERIKFAAPGTLLAICVSGARSLNRIESPWKHPDRTNFAYELREVLRQAELFTLLVQGATVLYQLLLAREAEGRRVLTGQELSASREHELNEWADRVMSEGSELLEWDLATLWRVVVREGYRVTDATRQFVEAVLTAMKSGPAHLGSSNLACELVVRRERALKGGLARLTHLKPLENAVPGPGPVGQLTYRWTNAKRIVTDIRQGLERDRAAVELT